MAASHPTAWRTNLILLVLLSIFAVSGAFVWIRREAWRVVEVRKGDLHYRSRSPAFVFDRDEGTIYFPETRQLVEVPSEFRGSVLDIEEFSKTQSCFAFENGEDRRRRCWNLSAGREVPVPAALNEEWIFSADGNRILSMAFPEQKRRFKVIGLDGRVVQERELPELPNPLVAQREIYHWFTPNGRYVLTYPRLDSLDEGIHVFEMASTRSWSFHEPFAALCDDGVLWLSESPPKTEGGHPKRLRALQLSTEKELWRADAPDGISGIKSLGQGKLAVLLDGTECPSVVLYDAMSGARLCALEGWGKKESIPLESLEICEAGPESFIRAYNLVWSARTGRQISLQGEVPWVEFFPDGRRVLVHRKCGWPGRVVEVETGKDLFDFRAPGVVVGPAVRLAGDQVLVQDEGPVEIWERRYPEGWKGHLVRPEVLLAVFLGAAMLVVWANRPRL